MRVTVRGLWRHPIKGHGRESVPRVALRAGHTMPWDRRWAIAHEAARTDGTAWAKSANFSAGVKIPALMAINAETDESTGRVTLTHPERPALDFDPDAEPQLFLDWVRPLMPEGRTQSARIIRIPDRGMTDTDYPSLSLLNLSSNADLSHYMAMDLSPLRWRGNIHFDGLDPWAELDWIGRNLRIGTAEFSVKEPIKRCKATTANPKTGQRDADTLAALNAHCGHQNFGIYTEITKDGEIAIGDTVELL